jgi:hypothetical protein
MDDEETPPANEDRLPEPTAEELELERIIAGLVERKYAPGTSEAECAFFDRVLNGLRYTYEQAGPIWESLDTNWQATPP